jgi:hypothetical protein
VKDMDIETLKKDLVANQKKFDEKVIKRNNLNIELIGIEFVINYIRASINTEEKKELVIKKN